MELNVVSYYSFRRNCFARWNEGHISWSGEVRVRLVWSKATLRVIDVTAGTIIT